MSFLMFINEDKNLCDSIKKYKCIYFPKGYPIDNIKKFFVEMVKCGIIFYSMKNNSQPGYYIIDWINKYPYFNICIIIVGNQVEYGSKEHFEKRGYKAININKIFSPYSKNVKQIKFESVEPGQESKENIWKHYDYNIAARSYNGRLYLYDYNNFSEDIKYKQLKKLNDSELRKIFKDKDIKGISINSYSDWDSWDKDIAIKFINTLKDDFKDVKINSNLVK